MARLAIQVLAISRRHAVPKIQSAWFAQAPEFERWDRGGGNVHRLARVDPSVVVEISGVVHAGATIGESSHVGSGCIVGPDVCIGSSVVLRYNVVLQNCSIGDFCTLHSGVCVGQDGFGFTYDSNNSIVKKPQELRVKIGNSVEIGANSSIDRGSWRDTVIGDNTKLDNLVQIGHNVVIGCDCMICGQVGIAGSCTLGDNVVLGGQAGVADHIEIASKVRIAAKSGVTSNITEPGDYAGFPAVPVKQWRESVVASRRLCDKHPK
ncbi:probable UDP-3-O-acylglucosamine N-acyltransferase 2, mitochondrial isoform X1 [Selaginella moellendorffii]|uniref:probable UDP-3-O-acylglucosamine N-acyltransferase 2, mitochondrial isoform X1 n=1 Tax=Selaginella moellendorffii TaxID=88036 RepID=UPI000D1CA009|nr:probable UDP-3-O-acylglucosamine N-acyltransferase 2, mitochondrial isoform X1 [Selaginella moellendorffii]|eukprot:XP_024518968.1 probable UDP-3-O-acylglucosamine N-acyltransferase 2, mitochondrial isoform X1 [Selaginella moellendorffii]